MKDRKRMEERLVNAHFNYMVAIDELNAMLKGEKSDGLFGMNWFAACDIGIRAQAEIKLLDEMLDIPSDNSGQEERGDTDGSH